MLPGREISVVRFHSWLTKLFWQLSYPSIATDRRRLVRRYVRKLATVERLEARPLLSVGAAAVGLETRVNTFTPNSQTAPVISMDATANYVVVWQSYTQDGSGYGIYAQKYSAAGVAQGTEFKVNTYTTSGQSSPSVARDSAGDFVVAWMSFAEDGSGYGIYVQRYNASGVAQGGEFRVNTYTTNEQRFPSVAIDSTGDFVIAWQSKTQDGSGYGIYAKRYNAGGVAQGSEFPVNTSTTNDQKLPSVAMDSAGDFVVTWHSSAQDGSGYGVYAQRYNAAGVPQGGEFKVNTYTTNDQALPSIAMDSAGDFVIAWQSYTQDGNGSGIYAQRYNAAGVVQGGEFKVNTYTTFDEKRPSMAMNTAGDFVINWQSFGQDGGGYGVYAQRYTAAGIATGGELRVNSYTTNEQRHASVTMDSAGDFVVTWESNTQDGGTAGIYAQRYRGTIGPIVTDVLEGVGPRVVQNGDKLTSSVTMLSAIFSENLNAVPLGANSVTNRSNWRLMRYGTDVSNQISGIAFGFNASLNRYVANVSLSVPLEGTYSLIALPTIQNLAGDSLDGEADRLTGGLFRRNFAVGTTLPAGPETRINTYTTGNQSSQSLAMDSAGNFVVTWQSFAQDGSNYGIHAQRYNAAGTAQGAEFKVNSYTTGSQRNSSVAMDAAGDFVVTWESDAQDGSGYGIYARRYNASGIAQGGEFKVNTYTTGSQQSSSVAMDAVGNFVIVWQSYGQDGSKDGIFAQRFNATGVAQGVEFQINADPIDSQSSPSVAMNSAGDFIVTWTSYAEDGSGDGVYAQKYNARGIAQWDEFQVNTYTTNAQSSPSVAMDSAGDFIIAWMSYNQNGSGKYDIYAQRYDTATGPLGNEFKVNTFTTGFQFLPAVAMDSAGTFVIAWTSEDQDGSGNSIYAQRYNSAGVAQGGEFKVNSYTTNGQIAPSVKMDAIGDFVIAWDSNTQDGSQDGIYAQRYQTDVAPLIYQIEPTPLNTVASLSTPITASLLVFDQDSTSWTGATIQISINYRSDQDVLGFVNTPHITGSWNSTTGRLTLSGTDTVSNYRTALRNVTYRNTSGSPNSALTRTIDFQVTDGLLSSGVASRDLIVQTASTPAVLSGVSGQLTYFENAAGLALAPSLVIADADSVNLASATVSFTGWQGEDRVDFNNIFGLQHTFTQDLAAHTALFTITSLDSIDHYQTLLRSVTYKDVSDAPNTAATRVATFRVNDGTSNSSTVTRNVVVSAVNDAPLLSAIETTPLSYKANDPAFPPLRISSTLLVGEPDSSNLTKATVQITAGYQNDANGHDVLAFTNQLGITGSFNAATGTLTLSGVSGVGNYRTALRSVTFSSSGTAVNTANRTLTIIATDNFSPTPASSLAITRAVTVTTANIPPALSGIPATSLGYVRAAAPVAIAPGLFVLDPDSINLTGATIQVTGNYQNGQDVLAATGSLGITATFTAATGTLTLSGLSSLANYQAVLRTATYKTNTAAASTATRTLTFIVNDGLALSTPLTRNITLT